MHLSSFAVRNFRRLKSVEVSLSNRSTVFVGQNNSGKTSATHVFRLFLGEKSRFSIHDFSGDCWSSLADDDSTDLPEISLDLWFAVDKDNVHRVVDLLTDLDWQDAQVGVRLAYKPRDAVATLRNYREARDLARSTTEDSDPRWPSSPYEYLEQKLGAEYDIFYLKLGAPDDVEPAQMENGRTVVDSLIRVDFLDAQRHLSDDDVHGRHDNLSKRLSRYHARRAAKTTPGTKATRELVEARNKMDLYFADFFEQPLARIRTLGYPGLGNPDLTVRTTFRPENVLRDGAEVHYTVREFAPQTLPERYNGLGYKNLIHMAIDVLDVDESWQAQADNRPPVHLVMIEEPEAHLHTQVQQAFVRQIRDLATEPTQFVLTTHSPHVLYESLDEVRYFRREGPFTTVESLADFDDGFVGRYLKTTHCDLFFAQAAVLVEGNVERMLLPRIIDEAVPSLRGCHLSVLEVGGAHARTFLPLVKRLGLTCLVITDLDSVAGTSGSSCSPDEQGAVTSNVTIKSWWSPEVKAINDLLTMSYERKATKSPPMRIAYQTRHRVAWNDETRDAVGRTFEDALVLQNLTHDLGLVRKLLHFTTEPASLAELVDAIHKRVRTLTKSEFALRAIALDDRTWHAPAYVVEGLIWLAGELGCADGRA